MQQRTKIYIALSSIAFLLLAGTLFYHNAEKWSYFDSFYFTGVTLTTIGYGDFHPTTTISKIGTLMLAFFGVAIVLYSLTLIASSYFEHREKVLLERNEKRMDEHLKSLILDTAGTMKETAGAITKRGFIAAGTIKRNAGVIKTTISRKLREKPE